MDYWQAIEGQVDAILESCERWPNYAKGLRAIRYAQEPHEAELRRQTLAAVRARTKFDKIKPDGLPCLPLRQEECEAMQRDPDNQRKLLGFFGGSWRGVRWGYHPSHVRYCRGVLAHPDCPDCLKRDPVLRKMYPPARLLGLGKNLRWSSRC